MPISFVAAPYLGALALIYVGLALQVVRLRRRARASFGDGGDEALRCAIRAHSHFAEYVPLIAVMVIVLELSGQPAAKIHGLMGTLVVARLLHPMGMYAKPGTLAFRAGRIGGMALTIAVTVICALLLLQSALG